MMPDIQIESITLPITRGEQTEPVKYKFPIVDPDLTTEGAAADAKKVGDELTDLKGDISQLDNRFINTFDIEVAPNLLDSTAAVDGYIRNNGSVSVSGDWKTTDYIPVEYGKSYTYSYTTISTGNRTKGTIYFRLEYDEAKNIVSGSYAENGISLYTPSASSVKYVRFSVHWLSTGTDRCFVVGTSIAYSEYGFETLTLKEGSNSEAVKKIVSSADVKQTRNLFDKNAITEGYISNSSGTITVSGDWVTTDYIPVEYGKSYRCSNNNSSVVGIYFLLEVDENLTPLNYINSISQPYNPSSNAVTFIRFSIHSGVIPTMTFEEGIQASGIYSPFGNYLLAQYRNVLYGKTWTALGDSLTEKNVSAVANYTDFIRVLNSMELINMGVGGTGYMRGYDNTNAFYQRAVNIPDCDIITIFGSGNDLTYYSDLGDVTDTGTTTICGCINETLDVIFTNHPTTPLLVIAPTPWAGNTPDMTTGMSLYCEKLQAICSRRGIAYLDLFHHSGLRPNDETQRELVFYDGSLDGHGDYVHPNKLGHSIIAPRIMQAMEGIMIF